MPIVAPPPRCAVLAERMPLYAEVAHVRVDATLPPDALCAAALVPTAR
jgi:hypothetical protein